MYCPECGKNNLDQAVFCEDCGTMIKANAAPSTAVNVAPTVETHTASPVEAYAAPSMEGNAANMTVPSMQGHAEEMRMPEVQRPQSTTTMGPQGGGAGYPRKSMSKLRKFILVELILLVAVCFGFYKMGMLNTSPERVAKEFVMDMNERNWSSLYDRLWIMEEKFTSKEMLGKGFPKGDPVPAKNYSISETDISENRNAATVWVEFMVPGRGESSMIGVSLVKDEEKRFFLFDTWKVVPDFMVYDYSLEVPKGAKVTLGGVELDASYKVDEDDALSYYNIPAVFSGDYEILVSQEPMMEYREEVDTDDGYFSLQNMYLSDEIQRALIEKAGKLFDETYRAAFADKSFNEISSLFQGEKTKVNPETEALRAEYDELAYYMRPGSDDVMRRMEVYDYSAYADSFLEDGIANVVVSIDFDGEYEEKYPGANYSGYSYGTCSYYYEYTNGEWIVTGHDLDFNLN